MLHIILFILKIIGISLLGIIGLLLLVLLMLLFVPVRYDGNVVWSGKANGRLRVHWLLHLLTLRVNIRDNQIQILFKAAGFRVRDSLKPRSQRVRRKRRKKKDDDLMPQALPEIHYLGEPEENLPDDDTKPEDRPPVYHTPAHEFGHDQAEDVKTGKIKAFFIKIRNRIRLVLQKVKALLNGIRAALRRIFDKIKAGKLKFDEIMEMIHDEENKRTFRLVKREVIKLLHHIKPTKLRAELVYGLEDPSATGYVTGVLAVLYPIYGDALHVRPDFMRQVLEGDIFLRGRIRLSTLLIIAYKVYRDRNFRILFKKFR